MLQRWQLFLLLAIGVVVFPARGVLAVSEDDHARLVARVVTEHAIPGFAALKDAASRLSASIEERCASNGANNEKMIAAFRDTATALAAVDFYRFGPLAQQGRREKLAFWPDPRGVVARQLRAVLAASDPALLNADTIAAQSAAIQGLPALEMLMSDKERPLEGPQTYQCGLAKAIAQNISRLASESYQGWAGKDGMREKMLGAGPQNEVYRSSGEASAELLKSLLTGLQAVSELQLKPRLDGAKRAKAGPYAKLALERPVFEAATVSLHKLYDLLELESHLAADKTWIKNWVGGTWRAIAMSDGLGGAAKGVAASDAPKLQEVVSRIGGMRMLIGKEMSNAAGIAIGFNELDGD